VNPASNATPYPLKQANKDWCFRHLGTLDIRFWQQLIAALPEAKWQADPTRRNQIMPVHYNTDTIPLMWDQDDTWRPATEHPDWKHWHCEQRLAPAVTLLQQQFGAGELFQAMLVRLMPGRAIIRHRDVSSYLLRCRRLHIPICTNAGVRFSIADEVRQLAAGEVWEINNTREHDVVNVGPSPRIHLLLDWGQPAIEKELETT